MWNPVTVFVAQKLNKVTSFCPPPPNQFTDGKRRKVLVIHCHPVSKSFSEAAADAVVRGLGSAGHEVRLRKLYCTGKKEECYNGASFPPALTEDERIGYHVQDNIVLRRKQEELLKIPNLAIEVKEAVSDLRWCDSLVFVYPTWWFNFPAALKGYFDRVFLPGVAFYLPDTKLKRRTGSTGLIAGLMNINKIGVVTTSGASKATTFYAGDNARRFLSRGFRALCAPNCQLMWHQLYDISGRNRQQRERFLKEVEEAYSTF